MRPRFLEGRLEAEDSVLRNLAKSCIAGPEDKHSTVAHIQSRNLSAIQKPVVQIIRHRFAAKSPCGTGKQQACAPHILVIVLFGRIIIRIPRRHIESMR